MWRMKRIEKDFNAMKGDIVIFLPYFRFSISRAPNHQTMAALVA